MTAALFTPPALLMAVLALTGTAFGKDIFTGCFQGLSFDENIGEVSSTSQCISSRQSYDYAAVYQADPLLCVCSSMGQFYGKLTDGSAGSCPEGSGEQWRLHTSFDAEGCSDNADGFVNDGDAQWALDISGCFDQCKQSPWMDLYLTDDGYTCQCGTSASTVESLTTCATTTHAFYHHDAGTTTSGLTRRKLRERLERTKQQALKAVCPGSFTACSVPGLSSHDARECVDTMNDLESCGGCASGTFGNTTAPKGQDCTQLGAAMGASTCLAGQCKVFKCRRGLRLVDGVCV
ncbi:hypothetical protein IAT38_006531 [Cryptococcus sp. DSM 104549]